MLMKRKLQLLLVMLIALSVFISLPSVSKAADSYSIGINHVRPSSCGVANVQPSASKGDEVIITIKPESGYMLKYSDFRIAYNGYTINPKLKNKNDSTHEEVYSFTMPDSDVQININFDTCYKITNQIYFPNSSPNHYGEVYDFGSGLCAGEQGRIFTNPKDGYILSKLELRNTTNDNVEETTTFAQGTVGAYDFTMPAADVYVYALFEKDVPAIYGINITPSKGGSISSDKTEAAVGDIVNLTVKENKGYKLKDIKIQGDSIDPIDLTKIGELKYKFVMPKTSVSITANFEKINNGGTNKPTIDNKNNSTANKSDVTSTNSTNKNGQGKDSSGFVKTGDTNGGSFILYTVVSLISIAGITFIFRYKKQH